MSEMRACGKAHDGTCYREAVNAMARSKVLGICDDCGRLVRADEQPKPVVATSLHGLVEAMLGQAEQALIARCRTCGQARP